MMRLIGHHPSDQCGSSAISMIDADVRTLLRPGGLFGPKLRAMPVSALWEVA